MSFNFEISWVSVQDGLIMWRKNLVHWCHVVKNAAGHMGINPHITTSSLNRLYSVSQWYSVALRLKPTFLAAFTTWPTSCAAEYTSVVTAQSGRHSHFVQPPPPHALSHHPSSVFVLEVELCWLCSICRFLALGFSSSLSLFFSSHWSRFLSHIQAPAYPSLAQTVIHFTSSLPSVPQRILPASCLSTQKWS